MTRYTLRRVAHAALATVMPLGDEGQTRQL